MIEATQARFKVARRWKQALAKITVRAFPKRVGPRILSLESVDYSVEQVNTTDCGRKKKIRILIMIKTKIVLHFCGETSRGVAKHVFSTSFPGFSPTNKKQSDMSIPDLATAKSEAPIEKLSVFWSETNLVSS